MDKMRERLRQRIADLGLNRAEVARRAGVNATMIRDILDRDQVPSVVNAAKIARAVGYTLQQLYEGETTLKMNLNVDGITRGQSMWAKIADHHSRIVPITVLSEDTVSIEISPEDEALAHGFRRGDVVSGQKIPAPYFDNIMGRECIIMAIDGRRFVGVLLRGSQRGLFDVRPLDVRQQEARDIAVNWAAPITLIIRGA